MQAIVLAAQAAGATGNMSFLVMMVAIFAIMWFFMIRPQQKRQKEIRKFQNTLTENTKVIIGGGIYGVVKRVNTTDNKVLVEIARDVTVEVDKNSVFADVASQNMN